MRKHFLNLIFISIASLIHAQDFKGNKSKWNYFLDGSFGFIPREEGIRGTSGISAGVTFASHFGLGISASHISYDTGGAWGKGVEARFAISHKLFIKLQAGKIVGVSLYDASGPNIYTYLPDSSHPFYWRGTIGVRFGRVLFAGISTMQTDDLSFKYQNNITTNTTGTITFPFKVTLWQFGISLPAMKTH